METCLAASTTLDNEHVYKILRVLVPGYGPENDLYRLPNLICESRWY